MVLQKAPWATPMELFTWPFLHYLFFFIILVVSFTVNHIFIRCDDVDLIKEKGRS
jgi:hypothetical protein